MTSHETPPEAGSTEEPDKAFVEEWAAKRTTAVPARVFQEEITLGIDDELKSRIGAPRGPRIRSHLVDQVVPIGRRILEVAINEAVSQKELHPRQSEWEPEWSRIAEASQEAAKALSVTNISYRGETCDISQPFQRLSMPDLFKKHLNLDLASS